MAFDPSGRQVHAYPAEGASYLRDVAGARVGEFVALVASGNGYRGRSMLAIYDRDGQLVYQEVFTGRAYTVASHPTEPVLFVGAHERVLRYGPFAGVEGADERAPGALGLSAEIPHGFSSSVASDW